MNPVLRLRRAFRSTGADEEQAEEAAAAIDDEYVGRGFFEARLNQQSAELRNQILVGVLLITALAVAVLTIVIAVFD
ncbi:MAG: hypothetical protein F4007_02910 [Chloroflexi bacterium]|nr:hypothetical protein [Chloroflexota bacterium]